MNSTQLLEEIRRLWLGPAATSLLTDGPNLLARCDTALREDVFPALQKLHEEYCVARETQALSSSTQRYLIPARAFNAQIKRIKWRDSAATAEDEAVVLEKIDALDAEQYGSSTLSGYYLDGDEIVIVGDPSGVIDIYYPHTPGKLVESAAWAVVDTVTPASNQVDTVSAPPASWGTGTVVDVCDADRSGLPRYRSLTIQTIASSTITFSSEIAGATFGTRPIAVGDYITLAGYAARPQVPEGLHTVIAQGAVALTAQAHGDREAQRIAELKMAKGLQDQLRDLDQRVEQKQVLINFNSRFRRGMFYRGRRRRFVL